MASDLIYLDNAATTWPKPSCVAQAMSRFLSEVGANPGRAGHRLANESARIVYDTREVLARLFHVADPLRIVFGPNATHALNLALRGILRSGDHVITSCVEHNSTMRPLRALEKQGVALTVVACSPQGFLHPDDVARAVRENTRMIALNHASNVLGSILPIAEVGAFARGREILFLVDAAQSAGACEIDIDACRIDLLAFTGHKSLYGPMGTGGLVIGERVDMAHFEPLVRGGTGSRSEHEHQPDFLPDALESGTPNVVGLAGLFAGAQWVIEKGVENIRRHEIALTCRAIDGLRGIGGVTVHGGLDAARQTATVSFTMAALSPSEAALRLDEQYGVLCRAGLHCSPSTHKTIGTFPQGTIRFSMGALTTEEHLDAALEAVARLSAGTRR